MTKALPRNVYAFNATDAQIRKYGTRLVHAKYPEREAYAFDGYVFTFKACGRRAGYLCTTAAAPKYGYTPA